MSAQVHRASSTLMSGTPSTLTAQSAIRARLRPLRGPQRCRRTPGPAMPARRRSRSSRRGARSRSGPRPAARRGWETRRPSSPSTRSASKARTATPVSTTATVSASSSDVAAPEPPRAQALEHRGLARAADTDRVDADLAEEDAVGGGDRLPSHAERPPPVHAVREVAQALAQLARAAPARRRRLRLQQAKARELRAQRGVHPPPPDRELLLHLAEWKQPFSPLAGRGRAAPGRVAPARGRPGRPGARRS